MINITLDVLQRIIHNKPDNYFARGVMQLIATEDWDILLKQNFIDRIPHPDDTHQEKELASAVIPPFNLFARPYQDYRFRYLHLSAFRKYPFGLHYGLDFRSKADASICNSLFVVGSNGSGKTSLYSAMEYLCLDRISAAKQRGFSMDSRINEYTSYAGSETPSEICISTNNHTTLSLGNEHPDDFLEIKDFLSTFFCSEVDIVEMAEHGENLDTFIMRTVGLEKLQRLSRKLEEEREEILRQISINPDVLNKNKEELLHEKDEHEMLKNLYSKIQEDNDLLGYWKSRQIDLEKNIAAFKDDLLLDIDRLNLLAEDSSEEYNSVVRDRLEHTKHLLSSYFPNDSQVMRLLQDAFKRCKDLQEEEDEVDMDDIELHAVDKKTFTIADAETFNHLLILLLDEYIDMSVHDKAGKIGAFYVGLQEKIKEQDNKLSEITDRIRYLNVMPERYNAHYKPLVELIKEINDEIAVRKRYIFTKTKSLLEKIVNDFLFPYERFEVVRENDTIRSVIYFCNEAKQEIPLTPRLYFNSFRYKLYSVSLKIAAAFIIKNLLHFNFPLVFDDVFYSSDFTNRSKVKRFIENIYAIHREIFEEEISKELQIIFFTHDEMLQDAARSATAGNPHTIYARLFDYREIRTSDERCVERTTFCNLFN